MMLPEPLHLKVERYIEDYKQLKKELKWRVSDRALMIVTMIYVINNKPLNIDLFIQLSDHIKHQVGRLSALNIYQRFTIAAMLNVCFENPLEKFQEYLDLYEDLIKGGFNRGTFTYVATLIMLTNDPDKRAYNKNIERSLNMYKNMKTQQTFHISPIDYPLAVILSKADTNTLELIDLTKYYYERLSKNRFSKGDDLKFLCHILALQQGTEANILIERSKNIFDSLKQNCKWLKPMHYPAISLLALLDEGVNAIELVLQLVHELNNEKAFKWYKDMNFITAVNFLTTDKMKESLILETGIFMTFEALMQAQQATIVAAISNFAANSSPLNSSK